MRSTIFLLLGVLIALAVVVGVVMMVALPEPGERARGSEEGANGAPGGSLPESLEAVEEPTEAFANALLDCSVALRGGDAVGMADCFTDRLAGTLFPTRPGDTRTATRWIAP